jgi:Cytochrome P450
VLDIAEETTDLALDVLERTIFSAGLFVGRDDLRAAMRTYFDGLGRIDPFDLFDLPDFIPRISRLSTRPRVFHQAVDMIAARERDLERHETGAANDVLMLLIRARDPATGGKLTRQDIRANVITFIAAGHESTANAITWTLYLLSRSTEWRECVRSEAERAGGETPELLFDRLSKTRAVVEESLRLYPPLAAISRMARSSDELAGMRVEAGAIVAIAPYVLHRHKMWGTRADEFDPARFLPGSREYIDRYAYLPFGAGARGCIGSIFRPSGGNARGGRHYAEFRTRSGAESRRLACPPHNAKAVRRFAHVRSAPNSLPAGAQVKGGCLRLTLLRYRGRPGFIGPWVEQRCRIGSPPSYLHGVAATPPLDSGKNRVRTRQAAAINVRRRVPQPGAVNGLRTVVVDALDSDNDNRPRTFSVDREARRQGRIGGYRCRP